MERACYALNLFKILSIFLISTETDPSGLLMNSTISLFSQISLGMVISIPLSSLNFCLLYLRSYFGTFVTAIFSGTRSSAMANCAASRASGFSSNTLSKMAAASISSCSSSWWKMACCVVASALYGSSSCFLAIRVTLFFFYLIFSFVVYGPLNYKKFLDN